ncbi:MAG: tRNA dihydrouridine synthase [Candidatus Dojkabacteria bacterium]
MNIYEEIKKKNGYISALAPMEGVTDAIFRQMICKVGRPDLFFTEFLNVEGFCSKGREKVISRLDFSNVEKPIVIQLWGNVPEYYVKTIEYVKELKPDGIDINMGCSVRDVLSSGRGSALIKDKVLVKEIIDAAKSCKGNLPLSIKTRIGYEDIDIEGWIGFLLEQDLDMLTMHGRLSKEGYSTPSRWEEIGKCVKLKNEISPRTLILGNGDVKSIDQGKEYVEKYHVDGFMVGRGILNNPWLFSAREYIPLEERFDVLKKHMELYVSKYEDSKSFSSQKKYVKGYVNNFDGASEIRTKLLLCDSIQEFFNIMEERKNEAERI